jgi:hypothetical protein
VMDLSRGDDGDEDGNGLMIFCLQYEVVYSRFPSSNPAP